MGEAKSAVNSVRAEIGKSKKIANELKKVLKTDDVAVVIDAKHMCVMSRGIQDHDSSTVTAEYSGKFKDRSTRDEFLKYLDL